MNLKTLKKKVWAEFSKYIRLKNADSDGYVECYTCGKRMFWEKDGAQAGHVFDGRCNAILFAEPGVEVQCYRCNCMLSGHKEEYIPKFIEQYGEEEFYNLKRLKNTTVKWSKSDLEEMLKLYANDVQQLKEMKGL